LTESNFTSHETFDSLVADETGAWAEFFNSDLSFNDVVGSQVGFGKIADVQHAMNDVAGSQTAMDAVAASQTAMDAITSSIIGTTAYMGSTHIMSNVYSDNTFSENFLSRWNGGFESFEESENYTETIQTGQVVRVSSRDGTRREYSIDVDLTNVTSLKYFVEYSRPASGSPFTVEFAGTTLLSDDNNFERQDTLDVSGQSGTGTLKFINDNSSSPPRMILGEIRLE